MILAVVRGIYFDIKISVWFSKEEVKSGLPAWLLDLVPAVKFDVNNVSLDFGKSAV